VDVQHTGTLTIFPRSVFFAIGFKELEMTTSGVDIELCSSTSLVAVESESPGFSL
jgi:hypothetical protein